MVLLQLEGTCMLQSVVGSWLPFEKFLAVPVCYASLLCRSRRNGDVTARSRVRSTTTTTRIPVELEAGIRPIRDGAELLCHPLCINSCINTSA